jgi:hypothetical protein
MKKGFLSFAAFVLALVAAPQAHALVGGPFDNGDFSTLLDEGGIYQASFRFKNGSGMAQFGTNVSMDTFEVNGGGTNLSVLNRSMFYYKGVTFLGTATGTVDHLRKRITGFTNGDTDVVTTGTTAAGSSNNQTVTPATTTLLSNNGVGLSSSSHWDAKITKSHPVLRFTGTGELTVINPTLAGTAFNAFEQLIGNYQPSPNTTLGTQIEDLVNAIVIADANAALLLSTLQGISDNADKVKMHVFGSRVFTNTTR